MDVRLVLVNSFRSYVMITHGPGHLETRSVMDLPDGKYESAMAALRAAMGEIRVYVQSVVQA